MCVAGTLVPNYTKAVKNLCPREYKPFIEHNQTFGNKEQYSARDMCLSGHAAIRENAPNWKLWRFNLWRSLNMLR